MNNNPVAALMRGIIDYAGLFPPAKLPLDQAVDDYFRYRSSGLSWILNRFICPYSRLDEFAELVGTRTPEAPVTVSVIAPDRVDEAAFDRFCQEVTRAGRYSANVLIDSIEARWSPQLAEPEQMQSRIAQVAAVVQTLPDFETLFVEAPSDSSFPLEELARSIGEAETEQLALKVRTGGVTPELFPSPKQLARFIAIARDNGVAFKATAGLHHPIRHYDDTVGADHHGFVNLYFAAGCAFVHGVDQQELTDILSERSMEAFVFSDEGVARRDRFLAASEMATTRDRFASGYGSCSFVEPIEDLQQLNLLPVLHV